MRYLTERCNALSLNSAKNCYCATIPVVLGVRGWLLTGPFDGAPFASDADDWLGFMPAKFALDPGTRWLTPSPSESLQRSASLMTGGLILYCNR